MRFVKLLTIFALGLILSSCYHAQIITDAQPSNQKIDIPWAHGFIFGLVAPDEVRTASDCENGVAKVETQISFLNGLVSAITLNIYTPMHITVTCAAGSATSVLDSDPDEMFTVSKDSDEANMAATFERATERSLILQKPIYIKFE